MNTIDWGRQEFEWHWGADCTAVLDVDYSMSLTVSSSRARICFTALAQNNTFFARARAGATSFGASTGVGGGSGTAASMPWDLASGGILDHVRSLLLLRPVALHDVWLRKAEHLVRRCGLSCATVVRCDSHWQWHTGVLRFCVLHVQHRMPPPSLCKL